VVHVILLVPKTEKKFWLKSVWLKKVLSYTSRFVTAHNASSFKIKHPRLKV